MFIGRFIVNRKCFAAMLWFAGLALTMPTQAESEQKFFGDYEYRSSCAACHGSDATGNGPVASQLTPKPPDLTVLSKNNGGVFPYETVFRMIDGRGALAAHGSGVMPVWGDRYSLEVKQAIVRARILELTYFLRSIQQ